MAQLGRALRSGRRGRGFESRRLDEQRTGDTVRYLRFFVHQYNRIGLAGNLRRRGSGRCASSGRAFSDDRSVAETESRRLDYRKLRKIEGFRFFMPIFLMTLGAVW